MSSTKQLASHICRALRTSQAIQPLHLTRLQRASARSQSANCRSAAWRLQQQNARDFKPVYHHIIASCPHSRQSQQFLKCKQTNNRTAHAPTTHVHVEARYHSRVCRVNAYNHKIVKMRAMACYTTHASCPHCEQQPQMLEGSSKQLQNLRCIHSYRQHIETPTHAATVQWCDIVGHNNKTREDRKHRIETIQTVCLSHKLRPVCTSDATSRFSGKHASKSIFAPHLQTQVHVFAHHRSQ